MWGCVFSIYPLCHCDDWENKYTLSYHHHEIGSMNYYPFFRVRSWNNGLRCMSFYVLIYLTWQCQCCLWYVDHSFRFWYADPDSKIRVANMGPTWVLAAPGGIRGCLWNIYTPKLYCHNSCWKKVRIRGAEISIHLHLWLNSVNRNYINGGTVTTNQEHFKPRGSNWIGLYLIKNHAC